MKLFTLVLLFWVSAVATAQVHVKGYTKKDGTYVAPHYRSAPDNTKANNYSTKGNVNPYTGKEGTVEIQPSSNFAPSGLAQPIAGSVGQVRNNRIENGKKYCDYSNGVTTTMANISDSCPASVTR